MLFSIVCFHRLQDSPDRDKGEINRKGQLDSYDSSEGEWLSLSSELGTLLMSGVRLSMACAETTTPHKQHV